MDSRSVLIVEDKRRVTDLLCELLHDHPDLQVVGTCREASAAVEHAQRLSPDVVLVSERVGAVSGPALCKVLRRLLPTAVLLLWADAACSATNRARAAESAVDAVLDRSLSFRDLTRALRCCTGVPLPTELHDSQLEARPRVELPGEHTSPAERMMLRCPGCDVEVRVQVQDMAAAVDEVRAFFLTHDSCATTIDLGGAVPTRRHSWTG